MRTSPIPKATTGKSRGPPGTTRLRRRPGAPPALRPTSNPSEPGWTVDGPRGERGHRRAGRIRLGASWGGHEPARQADTRPGPGASRSELLLSPCTVETPDGHARDP